MANCLCGSGLPIEECHKENDPNKIRKLLRYSFFLSNKDNERVSSFFPLRNAGFLNASYNGVLRFQLAQTPAGIIIYPLFLKKGDRCIRPLTIDGLAIVKDEKDELISVTCMLTPIHHGTIIFHTKDVKRDNFIEGSFYVNCEIKTGGNPFESVFAMEMNGERIALYHHTSEENEKLILSSGYFKGSKWSIQGTNELSEYHNIYFTSIPKIQDGFDLFEIGMCEKGTDLSIITDNNEVEVIEVYRENPLNRPSSLKVWIDWKLISTNHLILHNDKGSHLSPTMLGTFSWWEVFMPYIYRVPVKVNSYLKHTYNKKKNEYRLNYGPNFYKTNGFSAALGTDLHDLKVIWSEVRMPRAKLRPSDFGRLDPEWVEIWNNNFTNKIVNSLFYELILNK
jgi:hypothetical protein